MQAQQPFGRGVEPAGIAGIGKTADQIAVKKCQLRRDAVGDGLQEVALRLQGLFGRLALGDVDEGAVGAQEDPLLVVHGRAGGQRDEGLAVGHPDAHFFGFEQPGFGELVAAGLLLRQVFGLHQIAKAQATHDVLALEAQPLQRRLVDHLHHTLRIQRVVATRRLVVQVLGFAQGPAQPGVGGGQLLSAFPHAVLQLGAEALDRFLLLVQVGDVARDGQQHHRAALRIADR
ncbi:hypothetical protein D9M68_726140 [compost metagenome]